MTLKKFSRKAAGLAVFGALLAAPATGALAQGTPQERSDCTGDAFQFCGSVIPNVPQIEACLKANINQLSPACRSEFEPTGRSRLKPEHFS